MNFCLYPISKVLISKCYICCQEFLAQIPNFENFGPKCINFLILAKFCLYPISKVLISKCYICCQEFLAQIPNFENFGPKCINFLILAKFCLYAISKELISNLILTDSFNPSPKQSITQVTQTNSISPFRNLFGKRLFVFLQKSQSIMASIALFARCLSQKSKHILCLTILRFQEIKSMRKQVLKSY